MKAELWYTVSCDNDEHCGTHWGEVSQTPDDGIEGDVNCPDCGYLMVTDHNGHSVLELEYEGFNWDRFIDIEQGDADDRAYDEMRDNQLTGSL